MSADRLPGPQIPLVPLPDVVHFPCTDLKLEILEPSYQRLVRELVEGSDADEPQVGLVLLKPAGLSVDPDPGLDFFRAGTVARLLDAEFFPDGRVDAWLHGEQRFELTAESRQGTCRRGTVRLMDEPRVNEADAGIVAVRGSIVRFLRALARELGPRFPISGAGIDRLASADLRFEEMVNRLAAELDLPPLRKLALLVEGLPARGLSMLSILESRLQGVEMLGPFRHLAGRAEAN